VGLVSVFEAVAFVAAGLAGVFCGMAAGYLGGLQPFAGWPWALFCAAFLWAYSALECVLRDCRDPRIIDGDWRPNRFIMSAVAIPMGLVGPLGFPRGGGAPPPWGVLVWWALGCFVWAVVGFWAALVLSERDRLPRWASFVVPFWFGLPAVVLSGRVFAAVVLWAVLCGLLGRSWLSLARRFRVLAAALGY